MTKQPTLIPERELFFVEHENLVPDPNNVRDEVGDVTELADSIASSGLLQPLTAREYDEEVGGYKLIAGHRRHAAIGLLIAQKRWPVDKPIKVFIGQSTDESAVVDQLIENLHRSDLNPVEEGHAFLRLTTTFKLSRADLAKKVARSSEYITRRIALLKLPDLVLDAVRVGRINLDTGYSLAGLGDNDMILKVTRNGTSQPNESVIAEARNGIKARKNERKFTEWAIDNNIEIAGQIDYTRNREAKTVLDTENVQELSALVKIPAKAWCHITVREWQGSARIQVYAPMTDKQREAAKVEADKREEERRAEWTAEQASREAQRLATLPPEIVEWERQVAELKEAHAEAVSVWAQSDRDLVAAWAATVGPKNTARWAMLAMATYDAWTTVDVLGLRENGDVRSPQEMVIDYCTKGANELSTVLAIVFAFDRDLEEESGGQDATALLSAYRAKHGTACPQLTLPPHPDQVAAGVAESEISEEEAAAIIAEMERFVEADMNQDADG